jgi:hypothetical protein
MFDPPPPSFTMTLIRTLVQEALQRRYLSLEAEARLRQLMRQPYDREDFRAIMQLQEECLAGRILQQSREDHHGVPSHPEGVATAP